MIAPQDRSPPSHPNTEGPGGKTKGDDEPHRQDLHEQTGWVDGALRQEQGAVPHRFHLGDMEGGVHSLLDCNRIDHFGDRERTHKPWSMLTALQVKRKICGRQPDFLTGTISRGRGPTLLIELSSLEENLISPAPGSPTAAERSNC